MLGGATGKTLHARRSGSVDSPRTRGTGEQVICYVSRAYPCHRVRGPTRWRGGPTASRRGKGHGYPWGPLSQRDRVRARQDQGMDKVGYLRAPFLSSYHVLTRIRMRGIKSRVPGRCGAHHFRPNAFLGPGRYQQDPRGRYG
jgi:hypothetical protein